MNDKKHLISSALMLLILLATLSASAVPQAAAQQAPQTTAPPTLDDAFHLRGGAVEGLAHGGDETLRTFVAEHLAEGLTESMSEGDLLELLRRIRRISASAGSIMVDVEDGGLRFGFRGTENADVLVGLEDAAPYRIDALRIDTDVLPEGAGADPVPPITWDTLEERLAKAEEEGFSGTVLMVKAGKEVLHRGYGLANREAGLRNGPQTIFGIGSIPITFTRAAMFLLEQEGKLKLSDAVGSFFPETPSDKRGMLLQHLMDGSSGLPNFHHIPGEDEDYDLSWIDRETAVRRILGQSLLFGPGQGQAHSHSAFVLLAAVIEKVSGVSYADFLRQRFFDPADMKRTGPYGSNLGLEAEEFAVGYGGSRVGEINMPPHWGRTSWLVMGSGGMVSTTQDMLRWARALCGGKILSDTYQAKYCKAGISAGGSDRGFLFLYTPGSAVFGSVQDNLAFVASNTFDTDTGAEQLAKALAALAMSSSH